MTDTLPPGPELDCAVCERFMGWRRLEVQGGFPRWIDRDDRIIEGNFNFSTGVFACELVKAELVRRGHMLTVRRDASGVFLGVPSLTPIEATTEAHAVALLAVAVGEYERKERSKP